MKRRFIKNRGARQSDADHRSSCEWVCGCLPLLLGGDLPEGEDRHVRSHLIGCNSCRQELGSWLKQRKVLAKMVPDPCGSVAFFDGLHADILHEVVSHRGAPVWNWPMIAGIVSTAALFLIGLLIGMGSDRSVSGLLDRPAISDSVQSISDPMSRTRQVGYEGGPASLSRTVRATLEHAGQASGAMSEADKREFVRRFRLLWLRRALECGEVYSSADLDAEPGLEECRQLLRRFMRECRQR